MFKLGFWQWFRGTLKEWLDAIYMILSCTTVLMMIAIGGCGLVGCAAIVITKAWISIPFAYSCEAIGVLIAAYVYYRNEYLFKQEHEQHG